MDFERKDYSGNAPRTTLAADITAGSTTITVDSAANYPTGGADGKFVVTLSMGNADEEKVLCSGVSGNSFTVAADGRGYDGTTAASHDLGTTVHHTISKNDLDEANYAVTQTVGKISAKGSLLVGSAANTIEEFLAPDDDAILMWDATTASGVKAALAADASTISNITTTKAGGTSDTYARGDHVHTLQDGTVTPAKLTTRVMTLVGPFATAIATGTEGPLQMPLGDSGTAFRIPVVMDRAGSVVGLSCGLTTARSAGTLTFEVYKNGVAIGLVTTIDAGTVQYDWSTQAAGDDSFVAGDRLDVRYTSAGFTPTTNQLTALITVAYG